MTHDLSLGSNKKSLFQNRNVAIGTMHSKEQVIAPLLENKLNLSCVVPELNTDELGTFTGEIERKLSPVDTAREKCRLAMDATGFDLAVASEGSFGPHPFYPFFSGNEEIVLLMDRKNELEIIGSELTTETNFSGEWVRSLDEVISFSERIGFPNHALVLRSDKDSSEVCCKGINNSSHLREICSELFRAYGKLWIETDMRAMHNPTRMKAIERAANNLVSKMISLCPVCNFPGYWITEAIHGLPCSQCGFPTKSTLEYSYQCQNCKHSSVKKYPHQKKMADSMYCDVCNP